MAIDTNQDAVVEVPAKTVGDKKAAAMAKMSQTKGATKSSTAGAVKRLPIGEGESASPKIEVLDDKHVKASFSFKLDKDAKVRYGHTVLFDYSTCSLAEILTDATRSHVITVQRNLRALGDGALDATVYRNVNVKSDLLEAARSIGDPTTRGLHAFARAANVSQEQARKVLAMIASGELKL